MLVPNLQVNVPFWTQFWRENPGQLCFAASASTDLTQQQQQEQQQSCSTFHWTEVPVHWVFHPLYIAMEISDFAAMIRLCKQT